MASGRKFLFKHKLGISKYPPGYPFVAAGLTGRIQVSSDGA
jgi:hypothetical protein